LPQIASPSACSNRRLGDAAREAAQDSGASLFRPDPEALQNVGPKGCRERDIGCVTAARDGNASNARDVMARVEGEPAPIEKDFEPSVIVHWSRVRRHAYVAQKTIGVTRRYVHAAAESDREMGEVAANADPLLIGFIGGTGGAGILIAERQMVADEIADRLNPAPAAKCRSEQLPSDVTKLVGFAITAAERKNQRVVWQSFDRDLFGIELDRIGLAAILDDGVAANRQITRGRDKPANMVAECVEISLRRNRRPWSRMVSRTGYIARDRDARRADKPSTPAPRNGTSIHSQIL
jgi:hypothetical protein